MSVAPIYLIDNLSWPNKHSSNVQLDGLLSGEISGLVIHDFLTPQEVSSIISGYRSLENNSIIHINQGFDSYPMSFAQFDQMVQNGVMTEEEYFRISHHFVTTFEAVFKVNLLDKLRQFISSSDRKIGLEIPGSSGSNDKYVPFTFRELFPGEGCLKAHCENLFYKEFPSFFNHINKFSTQEKQLSFFIVLQNPDMGGELTLFDLLWDEQQRRTDDTHVDVGGAKTLCFDNPEDLNRDMLKPLAGSLVIFHGGSIWHRVETIRGENSRLTLGGFMSFSHDGNKLFCWS